MPLEFRCLDGECVAFECLVGIALLPVAVSQLVAGVCFVSKSESECRGRSRVFEAVWIVASCDEIRLECVVCRGFVFDCSETVVFLSEFKMDLIASAFYDLIWCTIHFNLRGSKGGFRGESVGDSAVGEVNHVGTALWLEDCECAVH